MFSIDISGRGIILRLAFVPVAS